MLLMLPAMQAAAQATPNEQDLLRMMKDAQDAASNGQIKKIDTPAVQSGPQQTGQVVAPGAPATKKEKARPKPERDQVILSLQKEIEELKSMVRLNQMASASTQRPSTAPNLGGKIVYNYAENDIYKVHTGLDRITDVQLQPGEKLTNQPMAGDTVRWKLGVTRSGSGVNEITHIILKPLESGIETNILVTTDRHAYHLHVVASEDWYMPSLSWNYPQEETQMAAVAEETEKKKQEIIELVSVSPEKLRFNYTIEGNEYDWRPSRVFDDGAKTYLQMPQTVKVTEAPALFVMEDGSEPMLVNYRIKGDYYIVDRLFEKAQLRVGPTKAVDIIHKKQDKRGGSFWSFGVKHDN